MDVWQQISIPEARINANILFFELDQIVRELKNREHCCKIFDRPDFDKKPSGCLKAIFDFLSLWVLIDQDCIDPSDTSVHPIVLEVHLII